MKVKELLRDLSACDPEMEVKVDSYEFSEVWKTIIVYDEGDAIYLRVSDEEK